MAWHERGPSGNYFICVRVGDERFRRSLKTNDQKEADGAVACVEENLRLLERGRLEIPTNADVVSFLLSNGLVAMPIVIPEQITLRDLFTRYFAAVPKGGLEDTTVGGMKTHQNHLERHLGQSFLIRTLTLDHLQEYVHNRAQDDGLNGKVTATTIRKAIVTLRTVWNWAAQKKLVEGPFPSRGLMYPKGKEKPPFMPFREVVQRTKGLLDADAAELWESVFLTTDDLTELLTYVKRVARHSFIYPAFVFCGHAGARRSEMGRAKISDLDFTHGFVTLRERKKSHEMKTTRRVPMSGLFRKAMKGWLKEHPGGHYLFRHANVVERSKKRHRSAGPLTRDELHDHFKRTLAGSKWENLRGYHVLRHSFISCLASKGVDQRFIDEFTGHQTEQQRRRYRHLFPNVMKQSVLSVFG